MIIICSKGRLLGTNDCAISMSQIFGKSVIYSGYICNYVGEQCGNDKRNILYLDVNTTRRGT